MSYADTNHRGKTGQWIGEVNWTDDSGTEHRLRRRFDIKKDADKYEAYVQATHEEPPWIEARSPATCFATIAEKFKEANPTWGADRADGRGARLEFAIAQLGNYDVKAVRGPVLMAFVEKVKKAAGFPGRPPANMTVNKYLGAVRKVLKHATLLDLIPAPPMMPNLPKAGKSRRALTWGEEDAIVAAMEAAGHHVPAFFVRVLAATGMRAGELHKIRADQIHTPEQRELSGIQLEAEQTKTGERRWVPLVPQAAEKLRAIIASKARPDQYQVYYNFKCALESAGAPGDHTIHSLRHTTSTRLHETGAQTLEVAMILGHETGLMTQHYTHLSPEMKVRLFSVAEKVQHRCGGEHKSADILPLKPLEKSA